MTTKQGTMRFAGSFFLHFLRSFVRDERVVFSTSVVMMLAMMCVVLGSVRLQYHQYLPLHNSHSKAATMEGANEDDAAAISEPLLTSTPISQQPPSPSAAAQERRRLFSCCCPFRTGSNTSSNRPPQTREPSDEEEEEEERSLFR